MRPFVWLVLFALYALAELAIFIWVASWAGWLLVILLTALGAVLGSVVMSKAGVGAVESMQGSLRTASVPANEVGDHGLKFVAGLLIAIPGFLTDLLGITLLIGPVRRWAATALGTKFQVWLRSRGFSTVKVTRPDGTQGSRIAPGDIVEGEILDTE